MFRTIFLFASFLLLWFFAHSSGGQPAEPTLPKSVWPKTVKAHGLTRESAQAVALREAVAEVKRLMDKHLPKVSAFVPDEQFVTTHVLDGEGQPGDKVKFTDAKGIEQDAEVWILNFRKDNWWKEVVRRDQESRVVFAEQRGVRAEERIWLAGRVTLGLVMVLLSGFGYVQVDRYTNYRYTNWLRVVGVGLVSVVLAAFWWFIQLTG